MKNAPTQSPPTKNEPSEPNTGRREGFEELTHIDYDSIRSILPAGDRIVICTEQKHYVVLDVARFENGSEADF